MMNNRPLLLRRDAFREAEEVVLVNMRWIREAQEWADRMEAEYRTKETQHTGDRDNGNTHN